MKTMIIRNIDLVKIPRIKGVYILFNNNLEVVYVGQSKDIRQRISQHISKKSKGNLPYNSPQYYGYIENNDERVREVIESNLIYAFNPRYNYAKNGKCPEEKIEQDKFRREVERVIGEL